MRQVRFCGQALARTAYPGSKKPKCAELWGPEGGRDKAYFFARAGISWLHMPATDAATVPPGHRPLHLAIVPGYRASYISLRRLRCEESMHSGQMAV